LIWKKNGIEKCGEGEEILDGIFHHCLGCSTSGKLFSSLLFSSILHQFSSVALRFHFQGHIFWLQRQNSFKQKFGNPQDHPQNPN